MSEVSTFTSRIAAISAASSSPKRQSAPVSPLTALSISSLDASGTPSESSELTQ